MTRRSIRLLEQLADKPTVSIPAACKGWAETLAAYRFFDNDKVTAAAVLAPHMACSLARASEYKVVLCIQDTTELDYTGKSNVAGLGPLNYAKRHGLMLHPTVMVTPERVPLGILDARFWTHQPKPDRTHHNQRPIEDKESFRWLEGHRLASAAQARLPDTQLVSVSDREGDIYELFAARQTADQPQAELLVRACHNRKLVDGDKLWQALERAPVLGEVDFNLPKSATRKARHVRQSLRAARVTLKAPYRNDRALPDLEVSAILAQEDNPPKGTEPVQWLLLTSLPVDSFEPAVEKLAWYLCRWEIEIFFRILKSGCTVEQLQLETVERLETALALLHDHRLAGPATHPARAGGVPSCPVTWCSKSRNGKPSISQPRARRRPSNRQPWTRSCA